MKYFLYIIVSALLQAFAYGYIAKVYSDGSSYQFYFTVFSLCSVFYFIKSFRRLIAGLRGNLVHILQLNVLTAIAFLSFFLSLVFIQASVSSLIEASIGPLVAAGASSWLLRNKIKLSEILLSSLLFVVLLAASIIILSRSGLHLSDLLGAGLSLAAGIAAAFIAVVSRKLGLKGVDSESVLALRFILAAIISLGLVFFIGQWNWNIQFIATSLAVAFFGIVFPLLLLQKAMQKIQPIFSMIALSAIPSFTYGFEVFLGSIFDAPVFFLITGGVVLSMAFVMLSSRSINS